MREAVPESISDTGRAVLQFRRTEFLIFALGPLSLFGQTAVAPARTSGPSLQKTEAWIHDSLPTATYGEFKSPYNPGFQYIYLSSADFDGCTMNIVEVMSYKDGTKDRTTITVPLGAVDPSTIKSEPMINQAQVTFKTTNDKPLIRLALHGRSGLVGSSEILTAGDYAPRLTSALRHLVDLCGGRKSPF